MLDLFKSRLKPQTENPVPHAPVAAEKPLPEPQTLPKSPVLSQPETSKQENKAPEANKEEQKARTGPSRYFPPLRQPESREKVKQVIDMHSLMSSPPWLRKPADRRKDLFPVEYVIDCDSTAAALRSGYSEKTAAAAGKRLLKDPGILQRIEVIWERAKANIGVELVDVLREYKAAAFADITEYCNVDGNVVTVKDLAALPPEKRRLIEGFRALGNGTNGLAPVLVRKTEALEALRNHFVELDKKPVTGEGRGIDRLEIKLITVQASGGNGNGNGHHNPFTAQGLEIKLGGNGHNGNGGGNGHGNG